MHPVMHPLTPVFSARLSAIYGPVGGVGPFCGLLVRLIGYETISLRANVCKSRDSSRAVTGATDTGSEVRSR